ncbi:leucyl aminopeptidase [Candidatus Micrarchaeota archaeon]|nr:leucyl aminopeptidase [Candidatus Micrarchaeota archaeon]
MDYSLEFGNFWTSRANALIAPVYEDDLRLAPARLQAALKKAKDKKLFSGKEGEIHAVENVVFVGLGKKSDSSSYEKAVGSAFSKAKSLGADLAAVLAEDARQVYSSVLGLERASYVFDQYKKEKNPLKMKVLLYTRDASASSYVKKALVVAGAIRTAMDLTNQPSNIATPEFMAVEARKIAKEAGGLSARVLDDKMLCKHSFGSLLAVGQGSDHPPRLVVLEYRTGKGKPWFVLVGKGITFDSGGISIKPSESMDKMKFDKSGACSVMAVMSVLRKMKVDVNVAAVLPFAENMPSGHAYKPGDVVKSYSGKTIEVLNTDAEGRVILADALSYALATYKPEAIVDLATLTGACAIALGDGYAGLFSNKPYLLEALKAISEDSGDLCWPLPLDKEHEEKLKANVGDFKNIGETKGEAGASIGAAFLKQFVDETPWVHLDIAGVAWLGSAKPYAGVGATGFGVRFLLQLLQQPNVFKQTKK